MLIFSKFKKIIQNNGLDNQKRQTSRNPWSNMEIAIVISAIYENKGTKVNVDYIQRLIPYRTESAIRNQVLKFAGMMQYFNASTTIISCEIECFEKFKRKILDPKRRNVLLRYFYKFGLFNKKTSKSIIDKFWQFN